MRLIIFLSLIFVAPVMAQVANPEKDAKQVKQIMNFGKKEGLNMQGASPLDLSDSLKLTLEAFRAIDTNKLKNTSEIYGALQQLETIYRQSYVTSDENFKAMQPDDDPGALDIPVSTETTTLTQLDEKSKDIEGDLNLIRANSLAFWNQSALVQQLQITEALNQALSKKYVSYEKAISTDINLTQDEKNYYIERMENLRKKTRLESLKARVQILPILTEQNQQSIKEIAERYEASKEELDRMASMKCGLFSFDCKHERKRARTVREFIKSMALLGVGGIQNKGIAK